MGIRKPSVKPKGRGVGGWGEPFGCPNNATVRCEHRHTPLYFGAQPFGRRKGRRADGEAPGAA
jgi:hypothetical protein